ncbi:sphingomyelin phosphodiesterase [Paludifilum halophilum]|uniref:Sphingomyelin phosphodiesterase n=1 Tax=Paludifilum halophilum TaxID=1642702 RepID=A0A235B4Q0_9BACL|nr:sphingomyelin phosphodiesterase [Paludifilum halophilum]OYD07211.1 sphingomyelin phosphodiesterase [Paludifilum halophilum]
MRRRICGWVLCSLLSLSMVFASTPVWAFQPEGDESDNVRLMAYNVYMLSQNLYPNWGQVKRAKLIQDADFIKGNDLIIFNEVFDNEASDVLLKGVSDQYPYQTPVLGRGKSGWDETRGSYSDVTPEDGGVAVVSQYPIEEKIQHVFQEGCGSDGYANKGFVYVKVKKNDRPLHVVGTHMQSQDSGCADGEAESIRRSQMEEIRNFIDQKGIPANETVFIGGDLNVIKGTAEYDSMLENLNVSEPQDYTGHPYTWDTEENSIAGYNYLDLSPQYLDYIFVEKDHAQPEVWNNHAWKVESPAWMVTSWGKTYRYTDYSDHYPVTGSASFAE